MGNRLRISSITPQFVDRIPKAMDDRVLYISEKFSTSAHNCCCGCGGKIVLPLKAGRWTLRTRKGKISLSPSVGNWSLACQSHYWIEDNAIRWSTKFTTSEIATNRAHDKIVLEAAHQVRRAAQERTFWQRLLARIKSWI